jgi:hypothetical protein
MKEPEGARCRGGAMARALLVAYGVPRKKKEVIGEREE